MYKFGVKTLEENGFFQYEISNFSKKSFERKHNLDFWKSEDYLGIGAGASSNFLGRRFLNPKSILEYQKNILKNFSESNFLEQFLSKKID